MEKYDIYKDISKRTDGDFYIGVVGPVRTGKSSFVTKFMQELVIPNIDGKYQKSIAIDEMPQSAEGKTVMTTEPKFVPSDSVRIKLKGKASLNVRLIDCVGYMVDGAMGENEDGKPRLVKTPWNSEQIPFDKAGEIGTEKVIKEHSTISIMVTTDGSFTGIARNNYSTAEEKCVNTLKGTNKPFIILLNVKDPLSSETAKLKNSMEKKYEVPVVSVDVTKLNVATINDILEKLLFEFPIKSVEIDLPDWMKALPQESSIITEIISEVKDKSKNMSKMRDFIEMTTAFTDNERLNPPEISDIKLDDGSVVFSIKPKEGLFYKILSEESGEVIENEYSLMSFVKSLSKAKSEYEKFKDALESVNSTGYGIVRPSFDDIKLSEPEIINSSNKYGIKLKATAPSVHLVKVDVCAEISPIVGNKKQGEDMAAFIEKEIDGDKEKIWNINVFGKTLKELIGEEMNLKADSMPNNAKVKFKHTLTKVVNQGHGGVICIII